MRHYDLQVRTPNLTAHSRLGAWWVDFEVVRRFCRVAVFRGHLDNAHLVREQMTGNFTASDTNRLCVSVHLQILNLSKTLTGDRNKGEASTPLNHLCSPHSVTQISKPFLASVANSALKLTIGWLRLSTSTWSYEAFMYPIP